MYHTHMVDAALPAGPVLVTGATGTVGRHVVAELRAADRPVRAADRDPASARGLLGDDVAAVPFDFTDQSTWAEAFDGVSVMFLMRPPQLSNVKRDMVPALRAAQQAGVRQVVLLSLQGAETNRVVPHARLEAWLRNSAMHWTFVRPSFFMENLSGTHAPDIRDDELVVPAGAGATSFVAAADVAAVATAALLHPQQHRDRAWTPTGPEALTYAQVAAVLSDVVGRPIAYGRPGVLRYARHARSELAMPWGMVAVTTAIYTVARLGRAAGTTDDVRAVTGRAPLPFPQWAEQHRAVWERAVP